MTREDRPILRVDDVSHRYGPLRGPVVVLRGISFEVQAGKTLAVVGESGAGKSTLSRLIAGLEKPWRGSVQIAGRPSGTRPGRVSPVQMVFQHPLEALNRFLPVAASVGEPLRALPRRERRARIAELLQQVGIDPNRGRERPSSFSGGQLQRIVMARALAADPRLLLCDEPTSALDVSVQAQIVNLLLSLQEQRAFACVLVTHDLGVARVLADEVLVLKNGEMVELSAADTFFTQPSEPYSRELLSTTGEQMLVRVSGSHAPGARAPASFGTAASGA